jgi:hypothetical protein
VIFVVLRRLWGVVPGSPGILMGRVLRDAGRSFVARGLWLRGCVAVGVPQRASSRSGPARALADPARYARSSDRDFTKPAIGPFPVRIYGWPATHRSDFGPEPSRRAGRTQRCRRPTTAPCLSDRPTTSGMPFAPSTSTRGQARGSMPRWRTAGRRRRRWRPPCGDVWPTDPPAFAGALRPRPLLQPRVLRAVPVPGPQLPGQATDHAGHRRRQGLRRVVGHLRLRRRGASSNSWMTASRNGSDRSAPSYRHDQRLTASTSGRGSSRGTAARRHAVAMRASRVTPPSLL